MSEGKSFLVVDDNPEIRESLKELLSQLDCSVSLAEDGYEAIDKSRERDYDVILLDVKMPGIDGIETAVKIRQENNQVFILLMTAFSMEELAEKALSAGVDGVIIKPFDVKDLLSHLSRKEEAAQYFFMLRKFWEHIEKSLGPKSCRLLFEAILKSGQSSEKAATFLERTKDGIFVNKFGSNGKSNKKDPREKRGKSLEDLLETVVNSRKDPAPE